LARGFDADRHGAGHAARLRGPCFRGISGLGGGMPSGGLVVAARCPALSQRRSGIVGRSVLDAALCADGFVSPEGRFRSIRLRIVTVCERPRSTMLPGSRCAAPRGGTAMYSSTTQEAPHAEEQEACRRTSPRLRPLVREEQPRRSPGRQRQARLAQPRPPRLPPRGDLRPQAALDARRAHRERSRPAPLRARQPGRRFDGLSAPPSGSFVRP
jgi:hypothetical protein